MTGGATEVALMSVLAMSAKVVVSSLLSVVRGKCILRAILLKVES